MRLDCSIIFNRAQDVSICSPFSAVIQKLLKHDSLNKGECVNRGHTAGRKMHIMVMQ